MSQGQFVCFSIKSLGLKELNTKNAYMFVCIYVYANVTSYRRHLIPHDHFNKPLDCETKESYELKAKDETLRPGASVSFVNMPLSSTF